MLWGVELDTEDEGEESVRVREGVRVLDSGRLNEMLRILSNGEGCCRVRSSARSQRTAGRTFGSDFKLME